MGWWFGSANGNGSFSLLNLPPGPLDVVAMRNGDISAPLEIPVDRAIIRRGVNPASGATLPVLDFNAAESFAPTTSTWTFNNVNAGEQMSVSQAFFTAGGTTGYFSLYPGVDRAQTVRTIYGIPLAQTIAGDCIRWSRRSTPSVFRRRRRTADRVRSSRTRARSPPIARLRSDPLCPRRP